MRKFEFEVVLAADTEMTEELADRLFEAGCDDGLLGTSCGGLLHRLQPRSGLAGIGDPLGNRRLAKSGLRCCRGAS